MRLECHLFVPYQGQTRFGLNLQFGRQDIERSDRTWDHRLPCGSERPPTCAEMVDSGTRNHTTEFHLPHLHKVLANPEIYKLKLGSLSHFDLGDGVILKAVKVRP